jgi:hypothetical protein
VKRKKSTENIFSYQEYVGGLGDAILRMYFSGKVWYELLDVIPPGDRAKIVLMSHSPGLAEIWKWHPKRDQIDVIDLGFKTSFHPWENQEWRVAHGIPRETPCPPYAPSETLTFYPSPNDLELLYQLRREKFVVLAATASTQEKSIPAEIRQEMASTALEMGFKVLVVGLRHYFKDGRSNDIKIVPGVYDSVDKLSVPGTIEAIKLSAGVMTAHSASMNMAWSEKKPVFLLYDKVTGDLYLPGGPVGYMQGMNRPDADHMYFSQYTKNRLRDWLRKR